MSPSTSTHASPTLPRTSKWYHIHLFRGMIADLRRRAPYYKSDWTDAWDYRVVPATVYMYFAKYVRQSERWLAWFVTDEVAWQHPSGIGVLVGYVR